jgi:hypothetical protein
VWCAGSALQLAKQSLDEAPYKFSRAVAKLASITFLSLAFSYWFNKPWFLTEGKTCCYIHQTFSWGFPTGRLFTAPSIAIKTFSGVVAGEKEDLCKGSFARTSFTLF